MHDAGIVHMDLKPQNVVLNVNGNRRGAKVEEAALIGFGGSGN